MPPPLIESYRFKRMVIDGQVHVRDLIVTPDSILTGWRRAEGHLLAWSDLEAALACAPAILVLGTGRFGLVRVPPEIVKRLAANGIRAITQATGRAVKTYNERCCDERVAAAFHLAC